MKTPDEWFEIWDKRPPMTTFAESRARIEEVQKDALNTPMANISDQRELEMAQFHADIERIRADQLHEEMIKWRDKYHEARRYLRQANKGAERCSVALELAQLRFKALNEHHFDTVKRLTENPK